MCAFFTNITFLDQTNCFLLGKDDYRGGLRMWLCYLWNRLTRILPIHYLVTLVLLSQKPPTGIHTTLSEHRTSYTIWYHTVPYDTIQYNTTSSTCGHPSNKSCISISHCLTFHTIPYLTTTYHTVQYIHVSFTSGHPSALSQKSSQAHLTIS